MIDVIIPAYNASETLGRALASLAAQTDPGFRVTVIDDCSEWNEHCAMVRTVTAYQNQGLDVGFVTRGENGGAGMARQLGIDVTDGEWLTFLDADDVLMPYAIEAFKVIIANNPDMNVLHSSFYKQHKLGDGKVELIEMKRGYTWMHGKLYRRSFIEKYDIQNDPRFARWADDSYFNAQCSELTPLVMNELPMMIYTDTEGSTTNAEPNAGRDKMIILMQAMYAAGTHTLKYTDEIGHLANTIKNIDRAIEETGVPLNDEEKVWYDSLCKMYEEHGVKPNPKTPKRKLFNRGH